MTIQSCTPGFSSTPDSRETEAGSKIYRTIELQGHLSLEDKATSNYRLLPFEMPAGIACMEVSYRFSADQPEGFMRPPGNVIDIGLFDPRGSEFLRAWGFRGWSGSARRQFYLSSQAATPGYLPGPILPGRWEIILGLYRILPQGCDYQVVIRLFAGLSTRDGWATPSPSPVLKAQPGWYRGDLHCHTHHSDAKGSLADLAAAGQAQALDFLAVTEHNTTSHLAHLLAHSGSGLLLVPGIEITTEYGHANAWGIRRWHEFRCETPNQMSQVVADVKSTGALISVNHPKEWGPPWTFGGEAEFDCLEVWQASWPAFNDQALGLWERLLRAGHRLTAVGGSDVHQPPLDSEEGNPVVGHPCTWVYAEELSVAGLLAGIKAGHVFISEAPSGPRLSLSARTVGGWRQEALMGDELRVPSGMDVRFSCAAEGARGCLLRIRSGESDATVPIDKDHFRHRWQIQAGADAFWRAEVVTAPASDAPVVRALSNPIYVRVE